MRPYYSPGIFINKRINIVLILTLFVFANQLNAQDQNIDSLKRLLSTAKDHSKVSILNSISKQYWRVNIDSATKFAEAAMKVSASIDFREGLAEANRNIGVAHIFMGNKMLARKYLDTALSIFRTLNDYKGLAATYNNLGVLLNQLDEYSASLKNLDSALILFRKLGDYEGEGSVLNYIGITYQDLGNYQKAIDYCLQGFELRKRINDKPGVVYSLINVGNMYLDIGQPETAMKFYKQSVLAAREYGMEPVEYSLNQLGNTFIRLKKYDSAEVYLLNKNLLRKNHHPAPYLLGQLYLETNRPVEAVQKFNASLQSAQESGNRKLAAESMIGLSKVFMQQENYSQ